MTGRSNLYARLLRGEVSPEHYVAAVKRAVDMRLGLDRKPRVVKTVEGYPPDLPKTSK